MKFKALAAAVALMSAASVANADWNDGKQSGSGAVTGNGELMLVVFDQVLEVSVIQDLGDSYMNFYNNSQDQNFAFSANLDALFASTFANSVAENLMWSVFVINNGSTLSSNPIRYQNGFMTTVNPADVNPDEGTPAINPNTAGLGNVLAKIDLDFSPTINNVMGGTFADNEALYGDVANELYAGDAGIYGLNALGSTPFQVTAAPNESMYFWTFESTFAGAEVTQSVGQWTFSLDNNTISYSAVPVPAAVWLLASGLLGLGAVSRRRKV